MENHFDWAFSKAETASDSRSRTETCRGRKDSPSGIEAAESLKLLLCAPTIPGRGTCSLAAARRRLCRITPTHGGTAFSPPSRADPRLAFSFLLRGFAASFLALRPPKVPLVRALAFIFRSAGFTESDRNGLSAALHFAALAAGAAL